MIDFNHLVRIALRTPPGEPIGLTLAEQVTVVHAQGWTDYFGGHRVVTIPDHWFLDLDVYTYTGKHREVVL